MFASWQSFWWVWEEKLFWFLHEGGASSWVQGGSLALSSKWLWLCVFGVVTLRMVLYRSGKGFAWKHGCDHQNTWLSLLLFCLGAGICDGVVRWTLKPTIQRLRPCAVYVESQESIPPFPNTATATHRRLHSDRCHSLWGMPSNHGTFFAYVATSMALLPVLWGWKWLAFWLAFLVGLSRIFLGVHFPGDIMAGWLVGGVFALLWWRLLPQTWFFTKKSARTAT